MTTTDPKAATWIEPPDRTHLRGTDTVSLALAARAQALDAKPDARLRTMRRAFAAIELPLPKGAEAADDTYQRVAGIADALHASPTADEIADMILTAVRAGRLVDLEAVAIDALVAHSRVLDKGADRARDLAARDVLAAVQAESGELLKAINRKTAAAVAAWAKGRDDDALAASYAKLHAAFAQLAAVCGESGRPAPSQLVEAVDRSSGRDAVVATLLDAFGAESIGAWAVTMVTGGWQLDFALAPEAARRYAEAKARGVTL